MKILITGGTGFLGTSLQAELRKRGHEVVALGRDLDLSSLQTTLGKFRFENPNVIIHAAALCGGIGANREQPGTFFAENARMNLNAVDAANILMIQGNLRKFVGLGSVCLYPKFTPVPFKEEDLWNGYPEETNAPYGMAKKMLMMQIQTYREEWGFPGIFLIPTNLYGPYDHFGLKSSHVIPALIRKFEHAKTTGSSVELWGTGTASREFLYVKDAAIGIAEATERYDSLEPINLGAGFEITIKDLAELIAKLIGYDGEIKWNTSMPDGQPRRCLDVSRAEKYFGFKATTPFEDGLKKTIDWYIKNKEYVLAKGDV
jgi:GDP-L-fucose synthase